MDYVLERKPKTNDYEIFDEDGKLVGTVVCTAEGASVYLLGDVARLLEPLPTPQDALEAFSDWAASNTYSDIPVIKSSE